MNDPGIIQTTLDIFAKKQNGEDVKLCIDGKKLAYGPGNSGEENLCGFEMSPTLTERKDRHEDELETVRRCKNEVDERVSCGNPVKDHESMKNALLISIKHMSKRVQELRELVVKREITVNNLMTQVCGDWKSSKLAPSISYLLTKLYLAKQTIQELLGSIDQFGYIVSLLNGTDHNYVRETGVSVKIPGQK